MSKTRVIIVGGGLAGLSCARRLQIAGITSLILEASDQVGGRARTDTYQTFLLDRGFQVLLTAYPEAKQILDYKKLNLARFEPGALVRYQGKFRRFVDPWRRPRHLFSTAFSPVASIADKLRVARLRRRVCQGTLAAVFARPEQNTDDLIREEGFSDGIIDHFFRPFLGGVFLESKLSTSSRKFEFVFRMFAQGDAAIPAGGMGAMALQIAENLPSDTIRTNAPVEKIEANLVQLETGEQLDAAAVIVACQAPAAASLFGEKNSTKSNSVTCLYFAADEPPIKEPILVLNGEGQGPINNLCVPSQVSASYAPPGQCLVSVTVLGIVDAEQEVALQKQVLEQLRDWFGSDVDQWRHLRTYRIPDALPNQDPPALSPVEKSVSRADGILHAATIWTRHRFRARWFRDDVLRNVLSRRENRCD